MKKIFIFMLIALFMLCNVNAVTMGLQQTENLQDYQAADKGNRVFTGVIVGNTNDVLNVINATENVTYDFQLEVGEAYEDFYLILESGVDNKSIRLMWYGDLTKDPNMYIQNLTLTEFGNYYFKVSPSYAGEPITLYIDLVDDLYFVPTYYVEEKPKGFNSLMSPLVTGFGEVISAFVNFWKVSYYVVVFVVSLAFVLTILGLAFIVFQYAKKVQGQDKDRDEED